MAEPNEHTLDLGFSEHMILIPFSHIFALILCEMKREDRNLDILSNIVESIFNRMCTQEIKNEILYYFYGDMYKYGIKSMKNLEFDYPKEFEKILALFGVSIL